MDGILIRDDIPERCERVIKTKNNLQEATKATAKKNSILPIYSYNNPKIYL